MCRLEERVKYLTEQLTLVYDRNSSWGEKNKELTNFLKQQL